MAYLCHTFFPEGHVATTTTAPIAPHPPLLAPTPQKSFPYVKLPLQRCLATQHSLMPLRHVLTNCSPIKLALAALTKLLFIPTWPLSPKIVTLTEKVNACATPLGALEDLP